MKIIWGGGRKKEGPTYYVPSLSAPVHSGFCPPSLPALLTGGDRVWKPQVRGQRIHGTQSSDVSLVRVYDVHCDTEEKERICLWDTPALG